MRTSRPCIESTSTASSGFTMTGYIIQRSAGILCSAARSAAFGRARFDGNFTAFSRGFRNRDGHLENSVFEIGLGVLDVGAFRKRHQAVEAPIAAFRAMIPFLLFLVLA